MNRIRWNFKTNYNEKLIETIFDVLKELETFSFKNSELKVNLYPLIKLMESMTNNQQTLVFFESIYYQNLLILASSSTFNNEISIFKLKMLAIILLSFKSIHIQSIILLQMFKYFTTRVLIKLFIVAEIDILDNKRQFSYIIFKKLLFETTCVFKS